MNGRTRRALSSSLVGVLLLSAAAAPTLAAKKDKAEEPAGPPPPIESAKGDKYRMASTKMADRVTRFADAPGDVAFADGTAATAAPEWSDIQAVTVAATEMPAKLLTKMARDYPIGVSGAFYGADAAWQKGDAGVFVAVEMAAKLPPGVEGQQVEIGLGGPGASPLQVGSLLDTRAGVERFSLSGVFSNGAFATGTTDVSGHQPGDAIEYYNTESGVFGFYSPKRATWYLIMPRDKETDSVVVSVRSSTEVGEVVDRLELPGGGHFVDLADATGGWDRKVGLPPLECRSLETFSAASGVTLSAPDATLIRYAAGTLAGADAEDEAALLQPAIDAVGSIPVTLIPSDEDADPIAVDGELAVAPEGTAVSLTFEAPAGAWTFTLDDDALTTPAGERIVDHVSLTGAAGVRTGSGLDGLVAGDASCATGGSAATDGPASTAEPAGTVEPAATDAP